MSRPESLYRDPKGATIAIATATGTSSVPSLYREAGRSQAATIQLAGEKLIREEWDETSCESYEASVSTYKRTGKLTIELMSAADVQNMRLALQGTINAIAGSAAISLTTSAAPTVGQIIALPQPATGDVTIVDSDTPANTVTKGTHWEYVDSHNRLIRVLALTDLTGAWAITGTNRAHSLVAPGMDPDAVYCIQISLSNAAAAQCAKEGYVFWRCRISEGQEHMLSSPPGTLADQAAKIVFDVMWAKDMSVSTHYGKLGQAILPAAS